jgi:uncharacterized protein YggE
MRLILSLLLCTMAGSAQTTPRPFVRAAGQASVFVQPDQVKIDLGVTTQGTTAQDAAAQNATQVGNLIAALQKLLGPTADIKTINYFVGPVYQNQPSGGPAKIIGYTATMTVEVTLGGITMAGAVIDTAAGAGATSIGSPQFSLQDPEPSRLQALKMAAMVAQNHANAIAAGLGRVTGAIQTLEEGTAVRVPVVGVTGVAGAGAATQVTPGLIEVQGTVVLQADLN